MPHGRSTVPPPQYPPTPIDPSVAGAAQLAYTVSDRQRQADRTEPQPWLGPSRWARPGCGYYPWVTLWHRSRTVADGQFVCECVVETQHALHVVGDLKTKTPVRTSHRTYPRDRERGARERTRRHGAGRHLDEAS